MQQFSSRMVSLTCTLQAIMAAIVIQKGFPQQQDSRPFNTFNLRNLQISVPAATARPLSMGGAGIALSDDPSAVAINPAGLAFFSRPAISLSTQLSKLTSEHPSFGCGQSGTSAENEDFLIDHNMLSAVFPFKSIRISTYRKLLFDARLKFESSRPLFADPGLSPRLMFQRNFASQQTDLRIQVIENAGSLAWRFSEKLNFGASLLLTRLEYNLTEKEYFENQLSDLDRAVCIHNDFTPDNLYLIRTVDERDLKLGASFGFLSKVTRRLLMGAVYNFRPAFDIHSNIFFPEFGDSGYTFSAGEDTSVTVRFNVPDSYGLGIAYKYRGWMNIVFDLFRINYSQLADAYRHNSGKDPRNLIQDDLEETGIDPEGRPDLTLSDQWEFHVGMEYIFRISAKKYFLPLRVGYYYEPGHILHADDDNPQLQAAFPQAEDRHHLTGGLGFFIGQNLRIDGAIDVASNLLKLNGTAVYAF